MEETDPKINLVPGLFKYIGQMCGKKCIIAIKLKFL